MTVPLTTAVGPPLRGLSPVRQVLPNGLVVVAKESRATPAITLNAAIRAGTVFDPLAMGGLAHFVSRTIDRGAGSRSADEIAEALDVRGVSLNVSVNRHVVSLVCTCLVEDFGAVLSLPLGAVVGYALGLYIMTIFTNEVYRLPFLVTPQTVAWTFLTVIGAAAVSALAVRRQLDRLDLVGVLKSRE